MTIELVPLCEMEIQLRPPVVVGQTPAGQRMVFEVGSSTVKGERLSGTSMGAANADWMTVGPDGVGTLDVRVLMQTDDGAIVFWQYNGRVDLSLGLSAPIYAAPRFETGDERYTWLNKIQAVAKGATDGQTLRYEVYEIR
jgi:hypothetical protein